MSIFLIPKELKTQYNSSLCGDWFVSIFNDVRVKLKANEIETDSFNYEAEVRDSDHCYAHCGKAKITQDIKIGSEKILIEQNQVFDIVRSYKYPLKKFKEILNKSNWNLLNTFVDSNNIAFFVCKAR